MSDSAMFPRDGSEASWCQTAQGWPRFQWMHQPGHLLCVLVSHLRLDAAPAPAPWRCCSLKLSNRGADEAAFCFSISLLWSSAFWHSNTHFLRVSFQKGRESPKKMMTAEASPHFPLLVVISLPDSSLQIWVADSGLSSEATHGKE